MKIEAMLKDVSPEFYILIYGLAFLFCVWLLYKIIYWAVKEAILETDFQREQKAKEEK